MKAKVNCPVCGQQIRVGSLEGHLESVHELTGAVTLRLNPVAPYTHELEAVPEAVPEPGTEPEPEPKKEKASEV